MVAFHFHIIVDFIKISDGSQATKIITRVYLQITSKTVCVRVRARAQWHDNLPKSKYFVAKTDWQPMTSSVVSAERE